MREYSKEFKASIIAKMLPPNNVGVPQLARETGIPKDTLYSWRLKHRNAPADALGRQEASVELSSEEKFAVVIEVASFNEVELSEYCRRKGFYPEQVQAWGKACMQANAPVTFEVERAQAKVQAKQVKQLEAEVRRKDKALAETAALLVLQKKVQAIWGEPEDEKSSYGSDKK
jgi:transposase-like protein